MEVIKTDIADVLLIKPKIWGDSRGYFVETWQKKHYKQVGITFDFVQDNHSKSAHAILRGLHFQHSKPQGKLVSVSAGEVLDVVLDIRKNSPTFGKHICIELDAENQNQLWVPPGLAHGFCVLSEFAHFHYKCTDYYYPEDEACIAWNDPDLAINWKINNPILSAKDQQGISFKDFCKSL